MDNNNRLYRRAVIGLLSGILAAGAVFVIDHFYSKSQRDLQKQLQAANIEDLFDEDASYSTDVLEHRLRIRLAFIKNELTELSPAEHSAYMQEKYPSRLRSFEWTAEQAMREYVHTAGIYPDHAQRELNKLFLALDYLVFMYRINHSALSDVDIRNKLNTVLPRPDSLTGSIPPGEAVRYVLSKYQIPPKEKIKKK